MTSKQGAQAPLSYAYKQANKEHKLIFLSSVYKQANKEHKLIFLIFIEHLKRITGKKK